MRRARQGGRGRRGEPAGEPRAGSSRPRARPRSEEFARPRGGDLGGRQQDRGALAIAGRERDLAASVAAAEAACSQANDALAAETKRCALLRQQLAAALERGAQADSARAEVECLRAALAAARSSAETERDRAARAAEVAEAAASATAEERAREREAALAAAAEERRAAVKAANEERVAAVARPRSSATRRSPRPG